MKSVQWGACAILLASVATPVQVATAQTAPETCPAGTIVVKGAERGN